MRPRELSRLLIRLVGESARKYAEKNRADNRGDTLRPLVNLYCAISVAHQAPLGGYDIARLPKREMLLRFAKSTDRFDPLGGNPSDMPCEPNVPVYALENAIACWAFNVRDSKETSLVSGADEAIFVGEAIDPVQVDGLNRALSTLSSELRGCGARTGSITVVNRDAPVAVISL